MDIEKLNPWNWFKHEDDSMNQMPVSKNDVPVENSSEKKSLTTPQNQAMDSLLQMHNEMDRLFHDVWRSFGIPAGLRLMRPTSIFNNNFLDNPILGDYRAKLDVSGSEEAYEVSIDLPGLSEDDIKIELNGNTLVVKGHKEEKTKAKINTTIVWSEVLDLFNVLCRCLKTLIGAKFQPI